MTQCGGALPDEWWKDPALLKQEQEAHGGWIAVKQAHPDTPSTRNLSDWWRKHGFAPLPTGKRSAPWAQPGEQVSTEEMLRARVSELERAARKSRSGEVEQERMLTAVRDAVKAADPRYKPLPARKRTEAEAEEAALLFSDTHAGEVVKAEQTLGMNTYDWDVMLERMARLQASMLSHLAHFSAPVKTLHVWCLGDMLSGDIHEELMATNDRPSAQAAVDFGYELARFVEELVPHFQQIRVAGVPGNHPRASKKPSAKDAHNNGDWIAYKVAEARLANYPSVSCDFPRANYATVTVAGRWRALLMHGDGIRSSMPGVPWGGVVRRITVLEQQFSAAKQPIDYVCLGHFHTAATIEGVGVETFLNGSVKGLDEYSLKQFGSGRRPSQRLLTFHQERGVTGSRWLNLIDHDPAAASSKMAA